MIFKVTIKFDQERIFFCHPPKLTSSQDNIQYSTLITEMMATLLFLIVKNSKNRP